METSAGFWLLAVLLLAALSFSQAQTVKIYFFKVGDTVVLSPVLVSEHIASIVWKYDKNLLVEWMEGSIELTYYSKFNGRSTLNTDTGVLEIRDMTTADTAVYSVEINNKVQSQVHQAVEIKEVPQPVVTVRPLMCSSSWKSCTLSCDGDVRDAEPVDYFWKKGDRERDQSEKNTEIFNNEEIQRVRTFSCRMKNPVSERDIEPINNPLYQEKNPDCGLWITVLGAVMRSLAILALFVVVVYFLWHK